MRTSTRAFAACVLAASMVAPGAAPAGAQDRRADARGRLLEIAQQASGLVHAAAPDRAQEPARIPTIDPPAAIDARLARIGSPVVHAMTRISGASSRPSTRLPDRVLVQVSVRDPRSGRLIDGPVHAAVAGGPADDAVRIESGSGVVDMRLRLTAAQRDAVSRAADAAGDALAARSIRVRLVQESDVSDEWSGREATSAVQAAVRLGGAPPSVAVRSSRDYQGTVTLENRTSSPLILEAGPAQCIYDTAYASTFYTNQQSFLGSLNGATLLSGSSITVNIDKDPQGLDGKDNDFLYGQVQSDYQQAIVNAYQWMVKADRDSIPIVTIDQARNPMGLPDSFWQSVGLFFGHAALDLLDASGSLDSGIWDTTVSTLQYFYPELADSIETIAYSLEVAGTAFLDYAEVVLAIVQALITLFTNGCDNAPGMFLLGATDMYEPWRQFSQVYNWNEGNVEAAVDASTKKTYTAFANGMITQALPATAYDPFDVSANDLLDVANGSSDKQRPVWVFQEPPVNADYPAVVDVETGTRVVSCSLDPRDARILQSNLQEQITSTGTTDYLMLYPVGIWGDLTTGATTRTQPTSPTWPRDYLVGYHYTAPAFGSTATVYWSADGTTWSSVAVPKGASSVRIPTAGGTVPAAALVMCVAQAPEMWNQPLSPLPTQRGVIMGTMVPSDIIPGPDYPTGG